MLLFIRTTLLDSSGGGWKQFLETPEHEGMKATSSTCSGAHSRLSLLDYPVHSSYPSTYRLRCCYHRFEFNIQYFVSVRGAHAGVLRV